MERVSSREPVRRRARGAHTGRNRGRGAVSYTHLAHGILSFNLNAQAMYEYEEKSDIIGSPCSLMNPYKGYTEGTICLLYTSDNHGNLVMGLLTDRHLFPFPCLEA